MQNRPCDIVYCGVNYNKIDKAVPKIDYKVSARLLEFIVERYGIHIKKDILKQKAPWTNNVVLQEIKFTNVRREHDKFSRKLIENITSNDELSLRNKIINTFLCRAWNNYETFVDFGGPWTEQEVYDYLTLKEKVRPVYKKLLAADPERKWFSSAYNQGGVKHALRCEVLGDETTAEPEMPLRPFHLGRELKEKNTIDRMLCARSQKEAFEVIRELRSYSDFMAYQAFVDFTYIQDFPFSENEFTIAGPGCKRGLDKLFLDRDGMSYEECLFWVRDHIDTLFKRTRKKGYTDIVWNAEALMTDLPVEDRVMNVMSLENCFCELSKYLRAVEGDFSGRVRYKGGKG